MDNSNGEAKHMSYVWEGEFLPIGSGSSWGMEWHLKKVWDKDPLEGKFDSPLRGQWKISVAWVRKVGDHKWHVAINYTNENDKTFRSLKAAKAYALAIVTLEN